MTTTVAPCAEFISEVIDTLERTKPTPGQAGAELIGGPYDGATVWLHGIEIIRLSREGLGLSLEVEPSRRLVAVYRLEPVSGMIRDGFRGRFLNHSVFSPDEPEIGGGDDCDPDA